MPDQGRLPSIGIREFMGRKVEQPLYALVQTDEAWLVEQPRKTVIDVARLDADIGSQIQYQHMIAAAPGKRMGFVAGHHAGMQSADRPALPHHLEICTPFQSHDQLMLGMGMRGALRGKIEDPGANHTEWPLSVTFHSSPWREQPQAAGALLKYPIIDTICCL